MPDTEDKNSSTIKVIDNPIRRHQDLPDVGIVEFFHDCPDPGEILEPPHCRLQALRERACRARGVFGDVVVDFLEGFFAPWRPADLDSFSRHSFSSRRKTSSCSITSPRATCAIPISMSRITVRW